MKVSVIIPTYNGLNKIKNLLNSFQNQTHTDFELIVSIDGSNDGTFEYLQTIKNLFFSLVIINESNGGRSISRNRGARFATGDLLVFLDDDMRVEETFVKQHLDNHYTFPNSVIVGTQLEDYAKMITDIQKYKAYLSRKWSQFPEGKLSFPYISAANFSLNKQLFFKLGGFDEKLKDAEDYDLAITAFESNVSIFYDRNLIGWHDDFITCKSYIKRLREYDLAQRRLEKIKPERYLNSQYSRVFHSVSQFKKIIYSFFGRYIWVKSVDYELFKYLPKFLKYRIYDYIITGLGVYFVHRKIE